ncbi:hypothetical protein BH23CHL2_BH23CHL2_04550 [soil metagenome]
MSRLSREQLVDLEQAIFELGEGTVEESGASFSRSDLVDTIREARSAMRDTVCNLPDPAFGSQLSNEEGDREWSAGEIVGHITESMLWLQFALRRLAGEEPEGAPADKLGVIVRDRNATLSLLDRADRELELALLLANQIDDGPRTHIDWLGDVGVRGLLLLHAMHEWEHANQIADLSSSLPQSGRV